MKSVKPISSEEKRLKKAQINKVAKLISSVVLKNLDLMLFEDYTICEADQSLILKKIYAIADKISKDDTSRMHTTTAIIKHALTV